MSKDKQAIATDADLAATLHEVSNGLTVVLGWLDVLADEASELTADERREAVDTARTRAALANTLARRAIGAAAPAVIAQAADAALLDLQRVLAPLLRRAGVQLEVTSRSTAPLAHAAEFDRVLTNLLLNAIAVTPAGGKIVVSASFDVETGLVVRVCDSGPGIPEGQRANLFVRGRSTRPGGAGIGLSHAEQLARSLGGSISLLAFKNGEGATFEVSWPQGDQPSDSAPLTSRAAQLDGRRVLVLDDDQGVCDLLDTLLCTRGAEVRVCQSSEGLRAMLAAESFDVVLLDASPLGPDLRGELSRLRQEYSSTRWVLVSGAPDPGAIALELGLVWIRKPFEIAEIIDVIRLLPGGRI